MKLLFFSLALTVTSFGQAQQVITIIDSVSGKPLPYATVINPTTGTGGYTNGSGLLNLSQADANTGLVASFVGYEPKTFIASVTNKIQLIPKLLPPVMVYSCPKPKTVPLALGKQRSSLSLGYGFAGLNWTTKIINAWLQPVKLKSLGFFIPKLHGGENPNTPIRIRLFALDSTGTPAQELTNTDLLVVPGHFGRIKVNLAEANIIMPAAGMIIVFEMFDAGQEFYYVHEWRDNRTGKMQSTRRYGYSFAAFRGNGQGWKLLPGVGWRQMETLSQAAPAVELEILKCR